MRHRIRGWLTSGNLVLKLIAFGIAFVIWIVVTNLDDPIRQLLITNVPITIVNEDSIADIGKVVEPEGSGTVTLKVTERSSVLKRLSRTGTDFYVEADLENINEMSTVPLSVTCTNSAITWDEVSIRPSSLKVSLEDKVEQAFAVTVTTTGSVANGYAVGSTQVLDGKNILIAGPKSLMNIINQVVAPVTVSGLRENATTTSTLRVVDRNGAEFTEAQMSRLEFKDSSGTLLKDRQVSVAISLWEQMKDVPLRVITYGTPQAGYYIAQISTIPQTVTLVGTTEALESLGGALTVADRISVDGVREDFTKELDLTETMNSYSEIRLPADADPVVSVEIQVERSGDITVDLPLGEIQLENRPEKMKLVFTPADMVSVTVHAVSAQAGTLDQEEILATLDLSPCEKEGNYEIPVMVTLPEGYELSTPVNVMVSSSPATSGEETGTTQQDRQEASISAAP